MSKTSKRTTNPIDSISVVQARDPEIGCEQPPTFLALANCSPSSSWPWRLEDFSPIEWWRSLPSDCLGDAQHLLLRATLDKICVMKGREWLNAMRGDAAASIAIAVEMFPITEITIEVDLAMTVLMLSALGGNAAAVLVLSQLLPRAPLDHPFARELSVSWLALNLRRALSKKNSIPKRAALETAFPLDATAAALNDGCLA
jgi:hypothetical protein